MSGLRNLTFFLLGLVVPGLAFSEVSPEQLRNFDTSTGQCTLEEKKDLQDLSIIKNFELFESYTTSTITVDMRRGSSPPTDTKISPLEAVACIESDGDKILITTMDPLDQTCGWVDENDLKLVAQVESPLGSSMRPCGQIKPLKLGDFCNKISKFEELSRTAKRLTNFCGLDGVSSSSIDLKFVTDNTTSRLTNNLGDELVRREVSLFFEADGNEIRETISIFSMNNIFDVSIKDNGDLRVLLGKGNRVGGWAELDTGHVWYSNLATYFKPAGSKDVFLGEIDGQNSSNFLLASKPPKGSFNVDKDYVKFPVLFDMRRKQENLPPSFKPQLKIAFIGEFCDAESKKMCAGSTNEYSESLSDLRAADVVFLVDGSKSMKQYFAYVADSLTRFTSDYLGNPDYRFGVAMYGDFKTVNQTNLGDPLDFKVVRDLKSIISNDFNAIKTTPLLLNDALKDKSEAVHAAVFEAARSFNWKENKPHIIIHIADHGDRQNPRPEVYEELKKHEIFYFPIAVEGSEVLQESKDFISQSKLYFKNHLTDTGNRMAVEPFLTYDTQLGGEGFEKTPSQAIDEALVSAINLESVRENDLKGSILPIVGPAVKELFKIPETDDIDTIAAVGHIETAQIGDIENNWDYYVALTDHELGKIHTEMNILCNNLGEGDPANLVSQSILELVRTLTGDYKSREETAQQIYERAIPLQNATIIGDGMPALLRSAKTGENLTAYKKEYCRTSFLMENMLDNRFPTKLLSPEEGQDLRWNEENGVYDFASDNVAVSYKWEYIDDVGEPYFFLPIDYLPRPINLP